MKWIDESLEYARDGYSHGGSTRLEAFLEAVRAEILFETESGAGS